MEGKEGLITAYVFRLFSLLWVIAFSETKWYSGEKYKKTPIWFSKIRGEIPAVFIWNVAIGCATFEQLKRSTEKKEDEL